MVIFGISKISFAVLRNKQSIIPTKFAVSWVLCNIDSCYFAHKIVLRLNQSHHVVGAAKRLADNDIYIAAFCLLNGYTLVTRNTKDFENIAELQQVNWIDG